MTTIYTDPEECPDTPSGMLRIIARGSQWREPYAVAIAGVHEVGVYAGELRGFVRRVHGMTPVLEVRDWTGMDVTHLYRREVA